MYLAIFRGSDGWLQRRRLSCMLLLLSLCICDLNAEKVVPIELPFADYSEQTATFREMIQSRLASSVKKELTLRHSFAELALSLSVEKTTFERLVKTGAFERTGDWDNADINTLKEGLRAQLAYTIRRNPEGTDQSTGEIVRSGVHPPEPEGIKTYRELNELGRFRVIAIPYEGKGSRRECRVFSAISILPASLFKPRFPAGLEYDPFLAKARSILGDLKRLDFFSMDWSDLAKEQLGLCPPGEIPSAWARYHLMPEGNKTLLNEIQSFWMEAEQRFWELYLAERFADKVRLQKIGETPSVDNAEKCREGSDEKHAKEIDKAIRTTGKAYYWVGEATGKDPTREMKVENGEDWGLYPIPPGPGILKVLKGPKRTQKGEITDCLLICFSTTAELPQEKQKKSECGVSTKQY